MIRARTILAYSLSATLLLSTSGIANAACGASAGPVGTWHFFAMQGATPDIKSITATVKNGSNANQQIKVFQNIATPYTNTTARAIKCVLNIQASGNILSSPCTSYGVNGGVDSTNVTGSLTLSSCNLSGTINIPGDTSVTIQGGHINGVSGAGIATQGAKKVLSFTLIKN
jgi:hypothetical protein